MKDHSFDPEIAKQYGIKEAIILSHLQFWIEKNRANDVNFKDDTYWTYCSIRGFEQLFPYMTSKSIRNALEHLKEEGVIRVENYNKSAYDRTLWYALTEKGETIVQKGQMHFPKRANGNSQKGKPIPYISNNIEALSIKEIYKESSQTDSPDNAECEMMQAENGGMGTPINTKKEGKKESSAKERKGEIELPFHSEEFVSLWKELLQEPKWKDKSVNALKRNLKDLEKMGEAGAIASIEQTIKRGYQGVFEVKGFTKSSGVNLNANSEWDD